MNYYKSLIIMLFPLFFVLNGCMQQDSMEMEQSSDAGQYSHLDPSEGDEQDTLLEVSLTGSSRAERFLGSYDQISRLALDVVRNYGNKEVVTDLEMDNSTGFGLQPFLNLSLALITPSEAMPTDPMLKVGLITTVG